MYCPKCGRVMTCNEGMLTCEKGNMPLSRHFQRLLQENYPVQQTKTSDVTGAVASRVYCPGCGIPLDKDHACPSCGKALPFKLFYQLIELHPHLTEDGQGWI